MKNIVRNILILIIATLVILVCYQKYHYRRTCNNMLRSEDYINHEYYCSFIRDYRIVNLLGGYVAEVPEWSYVVVDAFQDHNPITLKIPSKLKEGLEEGKYYEFKYTIVGNGSVSTLEDINKYITLDEIISDTTGDDIKVYLMITESKREGLNQIHENICQNFPQLIID